MGRLADKNILITGGNSGIGLAAAQEFRQRGRPASPSALNNGSLQALRDAWSRKSRRSRGRQQSHRPRHDVRHDQREFGHLAACS